MTWAKVDDRFHEHPKLAAAGAAAWGMWLAGIAYCNRALTDGFIPDAVAEGLGGRWRVRQGGQTWQMIARCGDVEVVVDADWIAVALVDAGLWHRVDGGYQIHDYADFQPLRADVMAAKSSLSAVRKEAGSAGGKAKAAKHADAKSMANDKQAASKTLANAWQNPSPEPDPVPEQIAADAAATRAPVPAREDKAPAAPPPPTTNTNPRHAPCTPEGKLEGHPARDVLLPMAHAALQIVGAVPEVATLESWYAQRWTIERVKFGLTAAKQDHAGQTIPVGKLIMSAARWMARARPDEYTPPRPVLTLVQAPAPEKPREATAEERAEMVRRFEELDVLLADPKPLAKAQ